MKEPQVYKKVYKPLHPKADVTGMVGEHILLAEEKIGRSLKKDELVHHCDFDRLNNGKVNLLVMTRLHHQQLPKWQARFILSKELYPIFLVYWEMLRDSIDEEHMLKSQIVQAENAKRRLEAKILIEKGTSNDSELYQNNESTTKETEAETKTEVRKDDQKDKESIS